jgi:hypothetical protein
MYFLIKSKHSYGGKNMSVLKIKNTLFNLACLLALPIAVFCLMPTECHAAETTIQVSPGVLNIQNSGIVITVRTNLDFETVNPSTVTLNGVAISRYEEDDCGTFVAKFLLDDIKSQLKPNEYNTLTLVGKLNSGEDFWGSQEVLVTSNGERNGN